MSLGSIISSKNIVKKEEENDLDVKCINNIKALACDMIYTAGSGHPGIALGAAPIIYTIYAKHLKFDPKHPDFINRDRFVLSPGHGSALLYATLMMSGYDLTIDDLKNFRKIASKTKGHPEYNIDIGVELTTGLLGQGFASAIGMAIAEKFLNTRYIYSKDNSLIDHYTYVMCSDGDLMEGISYEAASIAGNLGLNKLIVLYDSNHITLDGNTSETFKENVLDRFKAMNWHTERVGDSVSEIDNAIMKAKTIIDKPTIIEVRTTIGKDSPFENSNLIHGKVLSQEDITSIKEKLGIRDVLYTVTSDAINYMQSQINSRNANLVEDFNKTYKKIYSDIKDEYKVELEKLLSGDLSLDIKGLTLENLEELDIATRDVSSKILNDYIDENKLILGGSADLASSTKTYLKNFDNFTKDNSKGRNILFGVREQAMGAILNGIAISGIRCFGSTFLAFSDYLKPSIRMAALMKLPVLYILSHDSITIGADGATHQPVEQLVGLRSIPSLDVYRPADANEVLGSYKAVFSKNNNPSVIVLSKDVTPILKETSVNQIDKGAYIALKEDKVLNGIIIATGSELHLAIKIAKELNEKEMGIRVVSMPSIEKFEKTKKEYKEEILPTTIKKVVLEFSSSYSWYKYVYNEKYLINVNDFGASGSKEEILKSKHLTYDEIKEKIETLLK